MDEGGWWCIHQEKKNLPMIFHLGTCAIGMCLVLLAGHWQVGQQIGCKSLNTLLISWQWYKRHNWVDALLPKAAICDIFMGCNIHMHSVTALSYGLLTDRLTSMARD